MHARPVVVVIVMLASAWRAGVAGQDLPPQSRLASIDVVGAAKVGKSDFVRAAGLKVGAPVTLKDLQDAAERIGRTGLVSDVSFQYSYRGLQVAVTFTVVEAAARLAVLFDNFPWFTDEEITKAVASRISGFDGRLPDTSEAIDRVTETLRSLLQSRQLPGSIQYLPYLDSSRRQLTHLFKVSGAALPICAIEFSGVQPALEARLLEASRPLVGRGISRSGASAFMVGTLLPLYREIGHLQARIVGTAGRLAPAQPACPSGTVLSADIAEGASYTWKPARWTGNVSMTGADLDALLAFKEGEVANGLKLDTNLGKVANAYARKGYLTAGAAPRPQYDDDTRSVTFEIDVTEGPLYRMGALHIADLPDEVARRIRAHWKLRAGDVFDIDYPSAFLRELPVEERRALSGFGPIYTTRSPNHKTRTVDVTVSVKTGVAPEKRSPVGDE